MNRLYLDANATYGLLPSVRKTLRESVSEPNGLTYLNGSSIHSEGQKIRALIDRVRDYFYLATGLSEADFQVVFTSGATEGNNAALMSPFLSQSSAAFSGKVVSSTVEHSSVEESLGRLERYGVSVARVKPGADDQISPDSVLSHISQETKLLSLIWANNETGVIHAVPEIFTTVRAKYPNCILHVDGVQMFSKEEVDLNSFPFDFLTVAPHKFGALPGIGVTVASKQQPLTPLIVGGAQELRWRPGTENVLGIISLEAALRELPGLIRQYDQVKSVRDEFEKTLLKRFPGCSLIAANAPRLKNTSLIRIPNVSTEDLIVALDLAGVACSRGSACSSGKQLGSHVLAGMEYPKEAASEVVRFSFRADFEEKQLKTLLERVFLCFERFEVATKSSESGNLRSSS